MRTCKTCQRSVEVVNPYGVCQSCFDMYMEDCTYLEEPEEQSDEGEQWYDQLDDTCSICSKVIFGSFTEGRLCPDCLLELSQAWPEGNDPLEGYEEHEPTCDNKMGPDPGLPQDSSWL